MWKKPIAMTHSVEVQLPDLGEAAQPVFDQFKSLLKTVGITLAIGIPTVIGLAFLANVGSEVVIDRLTNHPE